MVLKDLTGKIRRFVRGRMEARGDDTQGTIPNSCLHVHGPLEDSPVHRFAVFFSGDGGWARLTTQVSKRLQEAGIPVLGIDSMHYFWKEKKPESAANDLQRLIAEYATTWATTEVILLGYSMGADVLPAIAKRLPESQLNAVCRIVLMSPGRRCHLKFRFVGWLGFASQQGTLILPDLEALTPIPISCFAGEQEAESLARDLTESVAKVELLRGGHHYGGAYQKLADRVLAHLGGT